MNIQELLEIFYQLQDKYYKTHNETIINQLYKLLDDYLFQVAKAIRSEGRITIVNNEILHEITYEVCVSFVTKIYNNRLYIESLPIYSYKAILNRVATYNRNDIQLKNTISTIECELENLYTNTFEDEQLNKVSEDELILELITIVKNTLDKLNIICEDYNSIVDNVIYTINRKKNYKSCSYKLKPYLRPIFSNVMDKIHKRLKEIK